MKSFYVNLFLVLSCSTFAQLNDNYFDEKLPLEKPELFLPEIVSSGFHEHSGFDISPNKDIALWTISLNGHKIILEMKKNDNAWEGPEVASFSGQYRDEFHFFSPDGQVVYFNSYRPENEKDSVKSKFQHWMVSRGEEGWGEAKRNLQWHPELWTYSMSENESVYGWATLDSTKNDADIYAQTKTAKGYSEPLRLSDSINSDAIEYCPFIDKEEKYIIFCRMGSGNLDGIYISFKRKDGKWTHAERLPALINQGYVERFPIVSPDGKYFFFNRQSFEYRSHSNKRLNIEMVKEKYLSEPFNRFGDIYWISADFIKQLKNKNSFVSD